MNTNKVMIVLKNIQITVLKSAITSHVVINSINKDATTNKKVNYSGSFCGLFCVCLIF